MIIVRAKIKVTIKYNIATSFITIHRLSIFVKYKATIYSACMHMVVTCNQQLAIQIAGYSYLIITSYVHVVNVQLQLAIGSYAHNQPCGLKMCHMYGQLHVSIDLQYSYIAMLCMCVQLCKYMLCIISNDHVASYPKIYISMLQAKLSLSQTKQTLTHILQQQNHHCDLFKAKRNQNIIILLQFHSVHVM